MYIFKNNVWSNLTKTFKIFYGKILTKNILLFKFVEFSNQI